MKRMRVLWRGKKGAKQVYFPGQLLCGPAAVQPCLAEEGGQLVLLLLVYALCDLQHDVASLEYRNGEHGLPVLLRALGLIEQAERIDSASLQIYVKQAELDLATGRCLLAPA